ncbi:LysR family transcriptional regulator [Inquilinus sp.]|uniref:LysR family transcriptional regulator n=1 Tax=Inquilinus sp. TaxID=1932117 RepID=UPI0031E48C2C
MLRVADIGAGGMNVKQLEAFKAIMRSGSTTAAAARLDLSQSAVSRLLTQLEAELGLELFAREKGRLIPTPEAIGLLDSVESAVDGVQRVQHVAEELRAGNSRQILLRIGVPHSMSQTILPRIVGEFLADHGNVALEILSGAYHETERAVLTRQADLGFVRLPTGEAGMDTIAIARTTSVCVMPQGHRLAEKAVVSVEDLEGEPLVLLGRQRPARAEMDQMFRQVRFRPRVQVETHSVGSACAFAAQGLGVTIVNALMASHFRDLPIAIRPFRPRLWNEFGLAFAAGQPRSRAADRFAEHFRRRLVEMLRGLEAEFRPEAG